MIRPVLVILFAQSLIEKVSGSRTRKLPGYDFSYNVFDSQWHQDFGHAERRNLDYTEGEYYVLSPDGRKQIVSYYADENGYFPTITYKQEGFGTVSAGLRANGSPKSKNSKGAITSFQSFAPKATQNIPGRSYVANEVSRNRVTSNSLPSLSTVNDRVYFEDQFHLIGRNKVAPSSKDNINSNSYREPTTENPLLLSLYRTHYREPTENYREPTENYREPTSLFVKTEEQQYSNQGRSQLEVNINNDAGKIITALGELNYQEVGLGDKLDKGSQRYTEPFPGSEIHFKETPDKNIVKPLKHKQLFLVRDNRKPLEINEINKEQNHNIAIGKEISQNYRKLDYIRDNKNANHDFNRGKILYQTPSNYRNSGIQNQGNNLSRVPTIFMKNFPNEYRRKPSQSIPSLAHDKKFQSTLPKPSSKIPQPLPAVPSNPSTKYPPLQIPQPPPAIPLNPSAKYPSSQIPQPPPAKAPSPYATKKEIPSHNSGIFPSNTHPNIHHDSLSPHVPLTPPLPRPNVFPEVSSNAIPSFAAMNINPDDSVVPKFVPVIIPVELDLDNSIFRDFDLFDNGKYSNSFGDYFDDDYL